jgi:hypothetical protein
LVALSLFSLAVVSRFSVAAFALASFAAFASASFSSLFFFSDGRPHAFAHFSSRQ